MIEGVVKPDASKKSKGSDIWRVRICSSWKAASYLLYNIRLSPSFLWILFQLSNFFTTPPHIFQLCIQFTSLELHNSDIGVAD